MGPVLTRLAEPFALSPLIVTFVVGISLGVVEFGLSMSVPLVIFVLIYVFWITPNYFLEIIEFKALGNEGWPVFSIDTLVAGRSQIGVLFSGLVLGIAGGYFALRHFEMDAAARILVGASLVVLPAAAALLAVTRELVAGLNPFRILPAIVGIGHAYLYCLIGAAVTFVLLELSIERGGLWYFPLVYALFLQAYVTGCIVYTRRTRLGVKAPRSPEARADRARAETLGVRRGVLTHAYGFAVHGNKAGALKHILQYLAADENTLEARLWMFNEISRWEDGEVALRLGERVAAYCEERGFTKEAESVRSRCEYLVRARDRNAAR